MFSFLPNEKPTVSFGSQPRAKIEIGVRIFPYRFKVAREKSRRGFAVVRNAFFRQKSVTDKNPLVAIFKNKPDAPVRGGKVDPRS